MKRKSFVFWLCALLFLQLFSLYAESSSTLVLQELKKELLSMGSEVQMLKNLQSEQNSVLARWQGKCETLEVQLKAALQELENSSKSTIELQSMVQKLRQELQSLKAEFQDVCKLLKKQKRKTFLWRTIAIVMSGAALTEGTILLLNK